MSGRLKRAAPLAAVAAVAAIAGALSFGASAAVADDTDGTDIGLEVTVTGGPTAPTAGSTTSGGSGGRRVVTAPDAAVAPAPAPSATPAPDEVDVGGILFLGGLSSGYGWSINPFAGEAVTSFTVRNVSDTVLDSTVRFSANGPFGNRLSEVAVAVDDLRPHESREVHATLTGLGQWTFIETRATLIPPKTVEGTKLEPVSRSQFIVVPPWLLLGGGAVGFGAAALVRGIRGPRLVDAPATSVAGAAA